MQDKSSYYCDAHTLSWMDMYRQAGRCMRDDHFWQASPTAPIHSFKVAAPSMLQQSTVANLWACRLWAAYAVQVLVQQRIKAVAISLLQRHQGLCKDSRQLHRENSSDPRICQFI